MGSCVSSNSGAKIVPEGALPYQYKGTILEFLGAKIAPEPTTGSVLMDRCLRANGFRPHVI